MQIVLLAGASGSGKSRLAHHVNALVVRLDDFYRDADAPDLPRSVHGFIDWDDVRTWDADGAVAALAHLSREGWCELPDYSIAESRRTGWHRLDLADHDLVIAEGIFAIELLRGVEAAGLNVTPLLLDRNRSLVAALRFRRDVAQHRKPIPMLIRRGYALWKAQPELHRRALSAGFRAVRMRSAIALLSNGR